MKVAVIGTGYLGLVSGVCLAVKGHEVTCVDLKQDKVDRINRGEPPIYEKGLEKLLNDVVGKNFRATVDLGQAVLDSELTLIAVGTPFDGEKIDLSYVQRVSEEIGDVLRIKDRYHAVVVNSTVVPGTTEEMVLPLLEERSGKKAGEAFGVGMTPEFLREGEAITDFMYPDRIVLGGIDESTLEQLDKLYAVFPE
ncbi:MAG: nucleotide sugar dehydrogenase, partial [Verrucomicrobiae bacterium]|nr:nucleotide sugar dehydrogenase [Verrucomicrobiae bacterium]